MQTERTVKSIESVDIKQSTRLHRLNMIAMQNEKTVKSVESVDYISQRECTDETR